VNLFFKKLKNLFLIFYYSIGKVKPKKAKEKTQNWLHDYNVNREVVKIFNKKVKLNFKTFKIKP
jgi:hypothetical protein